MASPRFGFLALLLLTASALSAQDVPIAGAELRLATDPLDACRRRIRLHAIEIGLAASAFLLGDGQRGLRAPVPRKTGPVRQ